MQPFTSSLVISINRNILECKVGISASHLRRRNVLIETYWNVNSFPAARNMASVGINRNILECKYGSQTKTKGQPMVLIETYWNVNVIVVVCGFCANSLY